MADAPNQPVAPSGHSIVGMSTLERRLGCPGSAHAEAALPNRTTAAAERGTALHEAAARALIGNLSAGEVWEEDEEGAQIIDAYLQAVRETHQRLGGLLLIEHAFRLDHLHPDLWGTADAVIVAPPAIAVLDLKSGRGHRVDVRRRDGKPNLQLAGYGLGALTAAPQGAIIERLELHVVQPLAGGHTQAELDAGEIIEIAADIQELVRAAMEPDAPRRPGDHCKFCRAAGTCPALRGHALEVARADFDDAPDIIDCADPAGMTPEEIAAALAEADVLELWVSRLREHAKGEAERGRVPPGFKLVQRRGIRRWIDPIATSKALAAHGLNDIWTEPALQSPAQVEKAIKRSKLAIDISEMTTSMSPGFALVADTDPRQGVQAGPAADFS